MRKSRRGGVGCMLTDDRRVFAGAQEHRSSSQVQSGLSPLLIYWALLRHDVQFMLIGCFAIHGVVWLHFHRPV